MIFWEPMGSSIHVDVTLTCTVPRAFVEHVIVADGNGILQIPQISIQLSVCGMLLYNIQSMQLAL